MNQARGDARETPAVAVRGLRVELGGSAVLDGINLSIRRGETVAVLGSNGSGKSTLVKSLLGLVPPASGRVEVFGAAGRLPWRRIGYVPQRMGASSGVPATAAEVVAAGLLDHRRLRPGRWAGRRSLEALEQVGLRDRAAESVQVFSGGQQQRVLIARALVREPDLLILDEPLAGMDRESREALARTLAALQARGTAVLLVLHDLGELAALIRRAVVLTEGRIAYDGPPRADGPSEAGQDRHPHEAPQGAGHTPGLHKEW
ncbi:metal ABC transporter ATP-binding protein [Arthrobacter crystallopoietes]|uniref:metal ABC transporter ATP-binding protein n=1 Tax=Crystallibacter crystallopoietes TaxID=37928 RepID=UPI003D1AEF01